MKKSIFICLTIFIAINRFVTAQVDSKAKGILDEMSKKYKSYDVVKTDFVYTLDNPQARIKESKKGVLYVKSKANKYKIILSDHELICDGKNIWTYAKADKEVQINEIDYSENSISPAKIFTVYEKGFKYLYVGAQVIQNKNCHIIDLTPTDTKKTFFKIRLTIDKDAMQIKEVLIFDKNGSKYTYAIKTFNASLKIPESTFAFDSKLYPGVEVVDLR